MAISDQSLGWRLNLGGDYMKRLLALALLASLTACVNNYQRFYQDFTNGNTAPYEKFAGEPRIASAGPDLKRTVLNMYEDGYGLIGQSAFVGPTATREAAIQEAKNVGAAIVLVTAKYQSTATDSIPITTPTSTTSYSYGTMNAFGSGGNAFGNYSGTTTTYGTQTTYVPYSVDRYNQVALFFAPLKREGFGVRTDKLSDEQRQRAETNQAIVITAVRRGSPAFKGDILPGDIVLGVDGSPVYDGTTAAQAVAHSIGREVSVSILRGNEHLTKKIFLPQGEW